MGAIEQRPPIVTLDQQRPPGTTGTTVPQNSDGSPTDSSSVRVIQEDEVTLVWVPAPARNNNNYSLSSSLSNAASILMQGAQGSLGQEREVCKSLRLLALGSKEGVKEDQSILEYYRLALFQRLYSSTHLTNTFWKWDSLGELKGGKLKGVWKSAARLWSLQLVSQGPILMFMILCKLMWIE